MPFVIEKTKDFNATPEEVAKKLNIPLELIMNNLNK